MNEDRNSGLAGSAGDEKAAAESKAGGDDARSRLLDAGERLFAERGFKRTSVRQITKAAGCNVAAVNYHFGGKARLYREVFLDRMLAMRDTRIESIRSVMAGGAENVALEDLLEAFARSFVAPLMDKGGGRGLMKLMSREMLDPQLPDAMFFQEAIAPVLAVMQEALAEVCPGLGQREAAMSIKSLVGQLLHTLCAHDMLEKAGELDPAVFEIESSIRHIIKFSAAGVRACAKGDS